MLAPLPTDFALPSLTTLFPDVLNPFTPSYVGYTLKLLHRVFSLLRCMLRAT